MSRRIIFLKRETVVFAQGTQPNSVFYIQDGGVKLSVLSSAGVFDPEQRISSVFANLVTMQLWPKPAPRIYLDCPKCHLPNAFVTWVRVQTRSCFCPNCRHLWDTIIQPVQE